MGRRWGIINKQDAFSDSKSDLDILTDMWGAQTPEFVAKRVRRTVGAVKAKAAELGYTQTDHQGWYPTLHITALLGVSPKEITRWVTELGMVTHDGPRKVFGRATMRMFALDEVEKFLTHRPEIVDPDWISPRLRKRYLFNVSCLETPFRWKRLECKASTRHAGSEIVTFWAPLMSHRPHCPACGRVVDRYAVGEEVSRYAIVLPPMPVPLSHEALAALIAMADGRSSIAQAAMGIGISWQGMSRMCARLTARRLVERTEPCPGRYTYRATTTGREAIKRYLGGCDG